MTPYEPHILVVDDHKSIRDPLADYLRKNGMRASTAANGTQTYATLKTSQIDLVILARIRGVLRRANSLPRQHSSLEVGFIQFGDWQLNVDTQTIQRQKEEEIVELSSAEFKLLSTFIAHPKMVLSREQLLDHVSNRSATVFDRSIDNQISRLRKKIERDPQKPNMIKTVWGGGYMFNANVIKL